MVSIVQNRTFGLPDWSDVIDLESCRERDELVTDLASHAVFDAIMYAGSGELEGVSGLLRLIHALDSRGDTHRPIQLWVICEGELAQALAGMAGSLARERPEWAVRIICLIEASRPSTDQILAAAAESVGAAIHWSDGRWTRRQLASLASHDLVVARGSGYRRRGVYVVAGGAGGVGMAWSERLIRDWEAQVIWLGRRPVDEAIEQNMDRLGRIGPRPLYIRADATSDSEVARARAIVLERFGRVDGVVHSTLVLADRSLGRMTHQELSAAFKAKAEVCNSLAKTFASDNLDFMLLFSSMQSFIAAAGQGNYAAGCGFSDAFADRLRNQAKWPVKVVNWGWWGSAGAVTADSYAKRMTEEGIASLEIEDAMAAMDVLLTGPFDQLGVLRTLRPVSELVRLAPGQLTEVAPVANVSWPVSFALPIAPTALSTDEAGFEALLNALLSKQLEKIEIAPAGYLRKWLEESRRMLLSSPATDPAGQIWETWESRLPAYALNPDIAARARLADTMLRALPDILGGRRSATEVMFPNGSMDIVGNVYRHGAAVFANDAMARLVTAVTGKAGVGAFLAEIGAGTGGATAGIVAELLRAGSNIEEYLYTDLSQAFLSHGAAQFGRSAPWLRTERLDISQSIEEQRLAIGRYDLVLASNVLHATPDIRRALRNAKALLGKGGLLILNELHGRSLYAHVTFGLLDGWWKARDVSLRLPGSPGLSSETWRALLEEEGFRDVIFPVEKAHNLGQQIIVGRSNGVLRLDMANLTSASGHVLSQSRAVERKSEGNQPQSLKEAHVLTNVEGLVRRVAGEILKIRPDDLSFDDEMESYGIDSLVVVQLVNGMRDNFPDLSSSSIFEHRTLGALAAYLIQTYPDAAASLTLVEKIVDQSSVTNTSPVLIEQCLRYIRKQAAAILKIDSEGLSADEPVESFGIDSLVVIQLVDSMREYFPRLSSTDIFEHRTLGSLAQYLAETNPEAAVHFGSTNGTNRAVDAASKSDTHENARLSASKNGGAVSFGVSDGEAGFPVAVVGMSGRFAGAEDVGQFWENLVAGVSSISEVPPERWDWRNGMEASGIDACGDRWGGFIDRANCFDPLFFGISPLEAERTDPQERLFLQEVWRCIENAGHAAGTLSGRKVGVFAGVMNGRYPTGARYWSVANRVSYQLNLKGPSLAIDTACSASLSAVHLAVESLRGGTCELALAGGVNLIANPEHLHDLSSAGMTSSGAECRAFGANADGFVDGEGVGVLLLRPLHDAISDGDRILGVIRGTATSHGGRTNGYTVPNPAAQAEVVAAAFAASGIAPERVTYIEAHGTGTPLGDPIEVAGLNRVFGNRSGAACALGSVKSNIGHTESAAGVAGVIKVLLQLQHGTIVPSLYSAEPNPEIDFAAGAFSVPQESRPWVSEGPRVAG
ncbi:SDR family NAD(P)-dependent oxidoreductase, partial [Sphingobium yanoikuyae]